MHKLSLLSAVVSFTQIFAVFITCKKFFFQRQFFQHNTEAKTPLHGGTD